MLTMPIPSDDKPIWKGRIDHGKPWHECYWHGWKMTVRMDRWNTWHFKVFREAWGPNHEVGLINLVLPTVDAETGRGEAEDFVRANSDLFSSRVNTKTEHHREMWA